MQHSPIQTVSSAELIRNFTFWQDRAAHGPISITYHGRPRYVLLEAESWGEKRPSGCAEANRRQLEYDFLVEHLDDGLIVTDENLRITSASSAAALMLRQPVAVLVGESLFEALPGSVHAALNSTLRHVAGTGERARLDLPFDEAHSTRLHVRIFPWVNGVALLLRIGHDDDRAVQLGDCAALQKAQRIHGGIHVLSLSMRGTVISAGAGLANTVGVPQERICGLRFSDLFAVRDRTAAREAIEQVLVGRSQAEAFDARLLRAGSDEIGTRTSMAPLVNGMSIAGAMVIITPQRTMRSSELTRG